MRKLAPMVPAPPKHPKAKLAKNTGKTATRDEVFADPIHDLVDFAFDQRVASAFPDMIRRSVPGYDSLIPLLGLLAARHAQPNSVIYDLGCSLGAGLLATQHALKNLRKDVIQKDIDLIGIDNAPAMLERARATLGEVTALRCEDIRHSDLSNASVVLLNFTLQFVPVADRLPLLERIHDALRPGGVLLMSEKLAFEDADEEDWMTATHLDFKRANGYSELEIAQKRSALENVLIPETENIHLERLRYAGFASAQRWFQALNFVSFIAHKAA
jgi:tRNA (cmo5U34)-methyltransferase